MSCLHVILSLLVIAGPSNTGLDKLPFNENLYAPVELASIFIVEAKNGYFQNIEMVELHVKLRLMV